MAYTRRGLTQVNLLSEREDMFPLLHRFIAEHYRPHYVYRVFDTIVADVTGLQGEDMSLLSLCCSFSNVYSLCLIRFYPFIGLLGSLG